MQDFTQNMSTADEVETIQAVQNGDIPSFFGVYYGSHTDFRYAVQYSKVNNGMHLQQDVKTHNSTRPCIRCKKEGCKFFVFARKRKTRYIAFSEDKITLKKGGKVIHQNFHHSCNRNRTNPDFAKVRRVLQNNNIRHAIENNSGQKDGILKFVAALALQYENVQLSTTSCHRVHQLILKDSQRCVAGGPDFMETTADPATTEPPTQQTTADPETTEPPTQQTTADPATTEPPTQQTITAPTTTEPQHFKSQLLTTKQADDDNSCFAIALLLGEASFRQPHHLLHHTIVEQIINQDALMLSDLLRDLRPPVEDEDHLIDMKEGLKQSKNLGFLSGQFVPTHFEKVEIIGEVDEFDDNIITYMGKLDQREDVEYLIKIANNIPTRCYCIVGVVPHFVVLTKSDSGEYALYESLAEVLNKDKTGGVLLSCSDDSRAVKMLMHWGINRIKPNDKDKCYHFLATVIKPSQILLSDTPIEMEDWRMYHHHSYCLDDMEELKVGNKTCLSEEVVNFFFVVLRERERGRQQWTQFFNKYSAKDIHSWASMVPGNDIFECEQIIAPVKYATQNHWSCLWVNIKEREIFYLDSGAKEGGDKYKNYGNNIMGAVKRYLDNEWKRTNQNEITWKLNPTDINSIPQQEHIADSGIFVCAIAACMSGGMDEISFSGDEISRLRVKIALCMMDKSYLDKFFRM
jgi:hypothetical protein